MLAISANYCRFSLFMEIYLSFLVILLVFSFLEVFKKENILLQKYLLLSTYLLSVFLIGLRWRTGTDWDNYKIIFDNISSSSNQIIQAYINYDGRTYYMEQGYLLLNWVVHLFTHSYSVFLCLHALIYYYFIIYGLKRITQYPISSYLFLFASSLGMVGSNRQLLAVAFIFYSLTLVIARNKWFFGVVVASITFHTTAVLGSAYYFFNRKLQWQVVVGILLGAMVFGYTNVPLHLFRFVGYFSETLQLKAMSYITSEVVPLSLIGIAKRAIFVIFFLWIRDKVEKVYPYYNLLLNGYLISLVLYLLFGSSLSIIVSRGSMYFNIVEGVLLTSVLYILKERWQRALCVSVVFALSIWMMHNSIKAYPDLFKPYKSLWYNQQYERNMY